MLTDLKIEKHLSIKRKLLLNSDRHSAGNRIVKYADDTYLIVPEANSSFSNDELSNIQTWATTNKLNLNYNKSKEIVVCASVSCQSSEQLPPLCQNVERVDKLTILGITLNAHLTATITSVACCHHALAYCTCYEFCAVMDYQTCH